MTDDLLGCIHSGSIFEKVAENIGDILIYLLKWKIFLVYFWIISGTQLLSQNIYFL